MLLAQNTEEKNTGTESINITVVYLSSNAKKFCKIVKLPMNVATYGYRAFNRLQGRKQKPRIIQIFISVAGKKKQQKIIYILVMVQTSCKCLYIDLKAYNANKRCYH